jgi:hypothetical protein
MGQTSTNQQTSQTQNTNYGSNSTSGPGYGPQQNFLQSIFGQLPSALQTSQGAQLPQNFTAGMTPQQLQIAQGEVGAGQGLAGNGGTLAGAGTTAAGQGYQGASSALQSLLGFNPAATNNTSNVINGANAYVNGMNIPQMVQGDMAAANANAAETTLPGLQQGMAGSGNVNSSRNGLAQGLVQSNLANQAAGLAANLQGTGYNTGAGLTEQQLQSNNANALSALTGGLYGGTGLGTSGALGATEGTNNAANAFGMQNQGAGMQQQNNQLGLTNQLQQYLYGTQSPFLPLQEAMGIGGGYNWGTNSSVNGFQNSNGRGTTNQQQNPSALSLIGSGLGIFGSL